MDTLQILDWYLVPRYRTPSQTLFSEQQPFLVAPERAGDSETAMGGGKEALGEDDQAGGPDRVASNDSTHFIRHHPREGAGIIIRCEAH